MPPAGPAWRPSWGTRGWARVSDPAPCTDRRSSAFEPRASFIAVVRFQTYGRRVGGVRDPRRTWLALLEGPAVAAERFEHSGTRFGPGYWRAGWALQSPDAGQAGIVCRRFAFSTVHLAKGRRSWVKAITVRRTIRNRRSRSRQRPRPRRKSSPPSGRVAFGSSDCRSTAVGFARSREGRRCWRDLSIAWPRLARAEGRARVVNVAGCSGGATNQAGGTKLTWRSSGRVFRRMPARLSSLARPMTRWAWTISTTRIAIAHRLKLNRLPAADT
jgi:hypothetical protein